MGAHLSLMHGWVPMTMQVASAACLLLVVIIRNRSTTWLGVSAATGIGTAAVAYLYIRDAGIAGDPAPKALWVWIALVGFSGMIAISGWSRISRWQRTASVLAVVLSLASSAVTVNNWVGYAPTVDAAWGELTSGPLPDQTDRASLAEMQRNGRVPLKGSVVSVQIDSTASGFRHRDELIYLPPAWFATNPRPALPAVMMIGGEFNTPADWLRAGDAVATLDAFAATHAGQAPVVVFVDSGGSFNIDTECVNGPRGNAADHLTKDVVPYLIRDFGVSAIASQWAVVGFSAGGTCAVNLAVMHPELFHSFVDIAGDLRPNSGTTAQTISRLFGGNKAAWQNFDPSTTITRHGRYDSLSGLFIVSGAGTDGLGNPAAVHNAEFDAAHQLCDLGSQHGIDCGIVAVAGKHDWPCAGKAFAVSLPWLSGRTGTSGIPKPIPFTRAASVTDVAHLMQPHPN